jgi:hypothetical protein
MINSIKLSIAGLDERENSHHSFYLITDSTKGRTSLENLFLEVLSS